MKTSLTILTLFISVSTFAQLTVSGRTTTAKDTTTILPANSITLTGPAVEFNHKHSILDTTWTKSSGPAASITNISKRMMTTVPGMVRSTYVFTLLATDKYNSTSATVNVTVLSAILPMELGYFHASHNDRGILISWQTDMESNNAFSSFKNVPTAPISAILPSWLHRRKTATAVGH